MSLRQTECYPNNWSYNEIMADLQKKGIKEISSFTSDPNGCVKVTY